MLAYLGEIPSRADCKVEGNKMDTRTGEIFKYPTQAELEKAFENNSFLIEVDCSSLCDFREQRKGKSFCTANRMQRRLIKCQIKRK